MKRHLPRTPDSCPGLLAIEMLQLQIAVSEDDGATWLLHAEHDMGAVSDPTIAFAPDATALIAANSPTAKGSVPGVVKLELGQ